MEQGKIAAVLSRRRGVLQMPKSSVLGWQRGGTNRLCQIALSSVRHQEMMEEIAVWR
jgi:hypothetical protein